MILSIVTVIMFTQKGDENIVDKNIPPRNLALPLQGIWEMESYQSLGENVGDSIEEKKLYISDQLVAQGDRFSIKPSFKTKYVNLSSYLKYKYNDVEMPDYLNQDNVTIVTISDGQRFYQDIFKINDDKLAIVYNGYIYLYHRQSKEVPKAIVKSYQDLYYSTQEYSDKNREKDLAVLLGVKRVHYEDSSREISYRTYLLRIDEKNHLSIYQGKNIFLPRADGFWTVKYSFDEDLDPRKAHQIISADPFIEGNGRSKNQLISTLPIEIAYIGPNFTALQIQNNDDSLDYRIFDVDHLRENKPVTIKEIAGDDGLQVLEEQIVRNIEESFSGSEVDMEHILNENTERNIGLERNNGKWKFLTSIKMNDEKEEDVIHRNIEINIVPNIEIANWPDLPIRWTNVKNLAPRALDAISSPDGRILIVQDIDELKIYDLVHNDDLLATIPISEKDSIIMAEWAMGTYSEKWEKSFQKTERLPVQYQQE